MTKQTENKKENNNRHVRGKGVNYTQSTHTGTGPRDVKSSSHKDKKK